MPMPSVPSPLAVGMVTGSGGGGVAGDGAAQLPGQRARGLRDGPEEVHPLHDLHPVLHHAGRRTPQPSQSGQDTRGQ